MDVDYSLLPDRPLSFVRSFIMARRPCGLWIVTDASCVDGVLEATTIAMRWQNDQMTRSFRLSDPDFEQQLYDLLWNYGPVPPTSKLNRNT
jgi:hypothetical protein